jgi:hypothetical protein
MAQMTYSSCVFPTGTLVPGTSKSTLNLVPGLSDTVTAPPTIEIGGTSTTTYQFMFWNVALQVHTTETATFTCPPDAFIACAWYELVGGGNGLQDLLTYAFSANNNAFETSQTPVAMVTPASAQTAPNVFSTASAAVSVTAKALLPPFGQFQEWVVFGAGTIGPPTELKTPRGGSCAAFGWYVIPYPNPCQEQMDQVASIQPGDFPNTVAYEKALEVARKALYLCQVQTGQVVPEPAPPGL